MPYPNKKTVVDALQERASVCSDAELKALFKDFGHDPEMLDAMQRGVDRDYKRQDSGSYLEDASPGYGNARRKVKLMEDFQLAAYKAASAKPAIPQSEDTSDMKALLKAVRDIQARLERLEDTRQKSVKRKAKPPSHD